MQTYLIFSLFLLPLFSLGALLSVEKGNAGEIMGTPCGFA